jgi:hypothetical protein
MTAPSLSTTTPEIEAVEDPWANAWEAVTNARSSVVAKTARRLDMSGLA